jgi:COMPASS component SDC1
MGNESTPNSAGGAAHTPTGESNLSSRPGGAPVRAYMNEKIVPYLLEGMKTVTKEQ